MLTEQMQTLIRNFSAGAVATISADGRPSVSPKATFVILNDRKIAFGNLRSPGTVANLRHNPAIEICFTDVITRKAVRVTGNGQTIPRKKASKELADAFETAWGDYVPQMSAFVVIDVTAAELILSPAYDLGISEDDLKSSNLARLNAI